MGRYDIGKTVSAGKTVDVSGEFLSPCTGEGYGRQSESLYHKDDDTVGIAFMFERMRAGND